MISQSPRIFPCHPTVAFAIVVHTLIYMRLFHCHRVSVLSGLCDRPGSTRRSRGSINTVKVPLARRQDLRSRGGYGLHRSTLGAYFISCSLRLPLNFHCHALGLRQPTAPFLCPVAMRTLFVVIYGVQVMAGALFSSWVFVAAKPAYTRRSLCSLGDAPRPWAQLRCGIPQAHSLASVFGARARVTSLARERAHCAPAPR